MHQETRISEDWDSIVIGSGNAALCAAIAAKDQGCCVLVIEKADPALAGGNSKYTAGAMHGYAALQQSPDRLGLELSREPAPGSLLCHAALLGGSGSLANPPLPRGKSSLAAYPAREGTLQGKYELSNP